MRLACRVVVSCFETDRAATADTTPNTKHEQRDTMKKEMLINVLQPEECRIAIVEDGVLEELYVERSSQESYVGNIYKGRIVNIEPSIQAAFVDFGIGRNGFLHVSDVDPAYYKHLLSKDDLAEYEAEMNREYGGGGGGGGGDAATGIATAVAAAGSRPDADRAAADDLVARTATRRPAAPSSPRSTTSPPGSPRRLPTAETRRRGGDRGRRGRSPGRPGSRPRTPSSAPGSMRGTGLAAAASRRRRSLRRARTRAEPPRRPAAAAARRSRTTTSAPASSTRPPPPRPLPDGAAGRRVAVEVVTEADRDDRAGRGRRRTEGEEAASAQAEGEGRRAPTEAEGKAQDSPATRKKADGEGDAERRGRRTTSRSSWAAPSAAPAADDEPEIRPFFDDGERLRPGRPERPLRATRRGRRAPECRRRIAETSEVAEDAGDAEDRVRLTRVESSSTASRTPTGVGRGFNDDFESARPPRRGGDRDRDRDRDRGGRGRGGRGDRDRDRGGRDRDRDRGPRGAGGPGGFKGGRDRGLPKPPIQDIFKRGQEVLVQVIKEGIGTKGPTPQHLHQHRRPLPRADAGLNRVGVSRKIEDDDARRRLREIMNDARARPRASASSSAPPAIDRNTKELQQRPRVPAAALAGGRPPHQASVTAPAEIYHESDMITRTIRDIFTTDIDTIWVDEPTAFAHASEFLQIVMPRFANRIKLLRRAPSRCSTSTASRTRSPGSTRSGSSCRCGGSIVIEQTEALVAIDVNSGNFRADNNAEETAYQMNLHAAKEIARQLRLRDLGGVIVNDFIDMRERDAPPQRRGRAARRPPPRPRPHEDPAHLAVRHHRDDPAAHPPVPEAQRLLGLPALPRRPGSSRRARACPST